MIFSTLRKRIDETLRTDADLDAFCVDHFPDIHFRFSANMERTLKVNLLLQLGEHAKISFYLNASVKSPINITRFFPKQRLLFLICMWTIPSGIVIYDAYERIELARAKDEYRSILDFRANEIIKSLEKDNEDDIAREVKALHSKNLKAMDENNLILSHDIAKSINGALTNRRRHHSSTVSYIVSDEKELTNEDIKEIRF